MLTLIVALMLGCPSAASDGGASAPSVAAACGAIDDSVLSGSESPPQRKTDGGSESQAKTKTPTKKNEKGVRAVWKQHPSLRVGSGFRIDVEALLQEDGHASYGGASDLEGFELQRKRIGIEGFAFRHVEFTIERELALSDASPSEKSKSPWKDVFVNVTFLKHAQVQIGKFKIPFGRDQLTGAARNDFVYRSLGAIYLASARDLGVMVHGRLLERRVSYAVGMFARDGENARSTHVQGADRTVAARVTGRPFRARALEDFEIGTAFTVSALSDDSFEPNGLRGRTVMTQDTFFEPVYVKGQRRRWEADVDWAAGPMFARAEYTWVRDDRLSQGLGNEDLPAARAQSWSVAGGWVVLGERKRERLHVALVGRYEHLWFNSANAGSLQALRSPRAEAILPSGERVVTLGVNWVLNRWVKLQANGIHERVEDEQRSPVPRGAAFWSRVFRVRFTL